jgi:transcription elongation factor Elf1
MESDVLTCPACGSADVRIVHDYDPQGFGNGRAICCYCGASFQFRWTEEPDDASAGRTDT